MQRAKVWRTTPSGVIPVALTGQTRMQGGLSQCRQGSGSIAIETRGYAPLTSGSTASQAKMRPSSACSGSTHGTLFSVWQATTHAWQAVHLAKSITIPQRGISRSSAPVDSNERLARLKRARRGLALGLD